jgi:hypothetical protein
MYFVFNAFFNQNQSGKQIIQNCNFHFTGMQIKLSNHISIPLNVPQHKRLIKFE